MHNICCILEQGENIVMTNWYRHHKLFDRPSPHNKPTCFSEASKSYVSNYATALTCTILVIAADWKTIIIPGI